MDEHALHPMKEIGYGAVSGMLGKVVEYPFDTVKVRLQSTRGYSRSALQCIGLIYRSEGIVHGFYQGLRAPLLGACLETAVLFLSYNVTTHYCARHLELPSDQEPPLWTKAMGGGFAGFMASFVLTPIELVKCRLQVQNVSAPAASRHLYSATVRNVLAKDGVAGLWLGLSGTLVREVFGTAVWFGTYEFCTQWMRERRRALANTDWEQMASGALAGVLFNFSMFPADTIKSNMQTHDFGGSSSFVKVGRYLCSLPGGARNLYSGLGITLVRSAPANAIIFYTYETMKKQWH